MTRVALLGATGSIGRQALEVIEANRSLELVAYRPARRLAKRECKGRHIRRVEGVLVALSM